MRLHVRDDLPGIGLVPAPVQLLGNSAKLDDEIAGEVLWLGIAALFSPQPQQGGLIVAHNDSSVRAADEIPAVSQFQNSACTAILPLHFGSLWLA